MAGKEPTYNGINDTDTQPTATRWNESGRCNACGRSPAVNNARASRFREPSLRAWSRPMTTKQRMGATIAQKRDVPSGSGSRRGADWRTGLTNIRRNAVIGPMSDTWTT